MHLFQAPRGKQCMTLTTPSRLPASEPTGMRAGQAAHTPSPNLLLRFLALEDEHAALADDCNDANGLVHDGRDMLEELLEELPRAALRRRRPLPSPAA